MKIFKIAHQKEEYMLENGMLYDSNAEDVFKFKELVKYKIPLFKSAKDANMFLEMLEKSTNRTFGRVDERDYMQELRYKDTRQEKTDASMADRNKRDEAWKRGKF